MSKMEITKFVLGMVSTNCYIVSNQETKEAILIDPADQADQILGYLKKAGLKLTAVLLTHGHFDHITGIPELLRQCPVPVYCHEDERELLADSYQNLSTVMGNREVTLETEQLLGDGQVLELAQFKIRVIHTPGHTRGGACYYFEEEQCLFAGDTLFMESVGRTDFPTGNAAQIVHSLKEKLLVLPEEVVVYPGHGPATSIGYEKENNPYANEDVF